jgi:hypothetical protein
LGKMIELLASLVKAVGDVDGKDLVLQDVLHDSYALNLVTPTAAIHQNLKVIHTDISQNRLNNFNEAQLNYARKLKLVMGAQLSLEAYDPQARERHAVNQFDVPNTPKHYFELSDVQGVLTSIGSTNLTEKVKSYIRITGFAHHVEINAAQEKELLPFFKSTKLMFTIRKRIDTISKEIKGAILEDFKVINSRSFAEIAAEIKSANPEGFFNDIENTPEFFHQLRNLNE